MTLYGELRRAQADREYESICQNRPSAERILRHRRIFPSGERTYPQVPTTLWVIYGQDRYGWSIFIYWVY